MDVKGKKIYVGLSGGVDSAVSAALLKEGGAHVTGVFIKGWYPPGMPCSWAAERRDAMRVAARLHIPFHTLDASVEYKKSVIDYLIAEYRVGRTPNPDVMCNRDVKFGAFYRFAKEQSADHIATGHYRSGEKDQSYFLWAVPKGAFDMTLFPIGHMEKSAVRTLAKKFDLPVADKRDSQGVCFLGNISVEEFLRMEFGTSPGAARDEQGALIGTHDGAVLHTLGERVTLRDANGLPVQTGPWFVRAKDMATNELVVGKSPTPEMNGTSAIRFSHANWLSDPAQVTEAQYRYRGPMVRGCINGDRFATESPCIEIPTPGQSLVFYSAGTLAGGGIIES